MDAPEFQEVRLHDGPDSQNRLASRSRPQSLRNLAHEILFVMVCTFAGASFVFLQRSAVVLTEALKVGLGMSPSEVSWITASSGLTTGVFLLPLSFIVENSRRFTRKSFLLGTLAVYCLLVGFSAASMNGIFLDIMSAFTGVTCACHIPVAISILSSAYPLPGRRKNIAFAFFLSGANPGSVIIGGLGAGLVESKYAWQGSFVFVASVYCLVTVLGIFVIPNLPRSCDQEVAGCRGRDEEDPLCGHYSPLRFDWAAVFLLVTGMALFTSSLTIAPESPQGWGTPYVLIMLVLGVLCLGCLILWEKLSPRPMIPPIIWRDRTMILLILFNMFTAMGAYSTLFWIPLFFETAQNTTPLGTAIKLLPQAVIGLLLSPLIGFVMHNVNNSLILAICSACQIGSSFILIYLRPESNYWEMNVPALVLSIVSLEWGLNVSSQFIFTSLPRDQHAIGAAVMQTMTRLAVPLGLAITTAVYSSFDVELDTEPTYIAFTYTFYAFLCFGIMSFLLVPFIRIGKQGVDQSRNPSMAVLPPGHDIVDDFKDSQAMVTYSESDEAGDPEHWTPPKILPRTSSLFMTCQSHQDTNPGLANGPSIRELALSTPSAGFRDAQSRLSTTQSILAERVIWLMCEGCGASLRMVEKVGDPARYFHETDKGLEENYADSMRGQRRKNRSSSATMGTTIRRYPAERLEGSPTSCTSCGSCQHLGKS